MRDPRIAYALALAGTLMWCVLLLAAPACVHAGGPWNSVGETIYGGFHTICHQLDSRSLHIFGLPLAACSRCTAIYLAFLAGVVAYPFFKPISIPSSPSRRVLGLALLPMLIDVGLSATGLVESNMTSRLITGAWFGFMVPFVVLPVYLGAVLEQRASHSPSALTNTKGSVDA